MYKQIQPQFPPIAVAYPVNSNDLAYNTTNGSMMQFSPPIFDPVVWMWNELSNSNSFTVRQHVKLLPQACCACPPCAFQPNTYSIYSGENADDQREFLRVEEVSDNWNRCCCKPYHPFKLEFKQHIPVPGDHGFSDFSHLSADVLADFNRISHIPQERGLALRNLYQAQPVLFSVLRNDGQRFCRFPCKILYTFVLGSCCQDGAKVFNGNVSEAGQEAGRCTNTQSAEMIGSITQPIFGGCCIPFLELRGSNSRSEPFAKVAGPCFFGGWSEMCCSFRFLVSKFRSPRQSGDIALISKKRPTSVAATAMELCSDADVYSIEFNPAAESSVEEKLTVMSSQLLLDYMLFDGNTKKCEDRPEAIYCYCCYVSIIGAICPIYFVIPKRG